MRLLGGEGAGLLCVVSVARGDDGFGVQMRIGAGGGMVDSWCSLAVVGGGLWGFTRDEDAIWGSAEWTGAKGAGRAKCFGKVISTSPRERRHEFIDDWEYVGN